MRISRDCVVVDFLEQHRCRDSKFQDYLNYLRYYKPSKVFLRELFHGRTLCKDNYPPDVEIRKVLLENSEALVLTGSRTASQRINQLSVDTIFAGKTAFASVQMDNPESPMLLYKGMHIIITQNRDKKNGVINGQNAEVLNFEQGTIFLKLPERERCSSAYDNRNFRRRFCESFLSPRSRIRYNDKQNPRTDFT